MKKVTLMLASLALLIGLASCDGKGKNEPKGGLTSVTVDPTEITLPIGNIKTLTVKWEPANAKPKVSYKSENEAVATVSAEGTIKAIAAGSTKIIVTVGDKTAECAVTVPKEGDTPDNPTTNEMPLLIFEGVMNGQDKVDNQEVLAHETKIGRELALVPNLQKDFSAYGFVNKELATVPVVVYDLILGQKLHAIVALGKEPMDNMPRAKKMLEEMGFKDFKEGTFSDTGDKYLLAPNSKDESVVVRIQKVQNNNYDTQTWIIFMKERQSKIFTEEADFPSVELAAKRDVAGIEKFESDLGKRDFIEEASKANDQLAYATKKEFVKTSNVAFNFYVIRASEQPFVKIFLEHIYDEEVLKTEEFKALLAKNGFTEGYQVGELEGGILAVQADMTKDGKTYRSLSFFAKMQKGGTTPVIEITEITAAQSSRQFRPMSNVQKLNSFDNSAMRKNLPITFSK